MKQTKRHKLCFGTDKGKTFQNCINAGKNSGDSKTVTLVQLLVLLNGEFLYNKNSAVVIKTTAL